MLSADNYVQSGGSTQSYNRYSYVMNNPLKYTDPSGEIGTLAITLIGASIGAITGGLIAENNGGKFWQGAAIGAVTGTAIGYGVGSVINRNSSAVSSRAAGKYNLRKGPELAHAGTEVTASVGGDIGIGNAHVGSSLTGGQGGKREFPMFSLLWKNYPADNNDGTHAHPSSDPYPNQCAIRVGACLQESGVDTSSYPRVNVTTDGYPRSSKGLADWIWQQYGRPNIVTQEDFENNYWNQTGIIYISPPPGGIGHIDLF